MKDKKYLFEKMPVGKALATLAIPTILSQLITMVYNLADTYFIGKTNDPYKIAAVSVVFVLYFVMNALSNLFGIGGGSLISRLLGSGQTENARSVCAFSFYGSLVITAVYSLVCFFFMKPILLLIGAGSNTLGFASDYVLWVICLGGLPTSLALTMSHILRSFGYARHASVGLAFGAVLNIILDPILMFRIFAPGNEVAAAAIATFISNSVTLLYFFAVFLILKNSVPLSLSPVRVLPALRYTFRIFAVGFPSALGSLLSCASNIVINKLVFGYGDISLAAMGIVKKIDMLPMNIGNGLCQGMMPLVAYNYSSGDFDRMKKSVRYTRICGLICAITCVIVYQVFPTAIVRLFIDEAETVKVGAYLLRICCLATPLMFLNFQMSYTFQALGKGKESLLLSSCRQGLFNIPLMFLMNFLFGLTGLAFTQLIADFLTAIVSFLLYFFVIGKINSESRTDNRSATEFPH